MTERFYVSKCNLYEEELEDQVSVLIISVITSWHFQ